MKKLIYLSRSQVPLCFVITILFSCGNQYPTPPANFDLHDKFVWIEDVDGRNGLDAPLFGDIVVFDLKMGKRYSLTDDSYYDESFTIAPNLKNIVFASARTEGTLSAGLSAPKHLYKLELSSHTINQFDTKYLNRLGLGTKPECYFPAFPMKGNRIAFFAYEEFLINKNQLFLYDQKTDSLRLALRDIFTVYDIKYSHDEKYLLIEANLKNLTENNKIVIYSTQTNDTIIISSNTESFHLGGINGDTVLISSSIEENYRIYVLTMNNLSRSMKLIYENKKYPFFDPVYGMDGKIYFLSETHDNSIGYAIDLYSLNIVDKTIQQITTDGREKEGLQYIK
jgi:hypothetical protein